MVTEVSKFLDNLSLTSEDTLVVAVSGGPDSMALFSILLDYRSKVNYKLVCAHVNHNVRVQSKDEAVFVREYCEKNNVIFEYLSIENWDTTNFHAQAHLKRYEFFESLLKKYNSKYLFTAHHGDDLVETILMHMVRGSTLKGYRGFGRLEKRPIYNLVRPLLDYSKVELLEYAQKQNIPYVIDHSNEKDKYTRNRYRKYIVPSLKEEEPNLIHKFRLFSETLAMYEEHVLKEIEDILPEAITEDELNLNVWHACSPLLQEKIIYYLLEQTYQKDLTCINKRHVELIKDLINSSKANASITLPLDIIVKKKYDKLSLKHKNFTNIPYDMEISGDITLPNGRMITIEKACEDTSNFICYLDTSKLSMPLHVRSRKIGDVMEVKGLGGHKKIKDIFIDEKVDVELRSIWPVVTDNNGIIVWLPGLKKSKFDTKEQNYDIILKYR